MCKDGSSHRAEVGRGTVSTALAVHVPIPAELYQQSHDDNIVTSHSMNSLHFLLLDLKSINFLAKSFPLFCKIKRLRNALS